MLEALEKIFDINFQPDIDIDILNITRIEGEDRFQADGRTLHLNIDELEPEELRQLQQLPQDQFESEGRVLRDDEAGEVNAIEAGYSTDYDEIIEYFDGILNDRYLSIVEDSLYLRALIEERDMSKDEIDQRKRDLARKYGPEAAYLSNLVSAGYFDRDGGLRDLYVDMGLNEQYDKYNFQQELADLVESKLLCIFVEYDDDVRDITHEVRGRLSRYQDLDPIHDWLDIRGIGEGCEEIIDEVVANLKDEFIGLDYDRWADGDRTVVRIHPHSLPPIGS